MPQENPERILVHSAKQFRSWLQKNHKTKSHVLVTRYKKHAQPNAPTHLELMHEAICFGWIDTTAKRISEDLTGVTFRKRTKNATWSNNTLSYAQRLIESGKMTPAGLEAYNLGKDKPTIDLILPENHMPKDLLSALNKNSEAKDNFEKLAPSYKKIYIRWIERAKLPETRNKRIQTVLKNMLAKKTKWDGKY